MNRRKDGPQELSSKEPVSVLRQVIPSLRPKMMDPRFNRAFGEFHEDQFKAAYSFIGDMQKSERHTLEKSLQKERDPRRIDAIKQALDRQKSQEKSMEREQFHKNAIKEWKKTERELVAQGKTPFHLKKSDERKIVLMAKYKQLKENSTNRPLNIDKLVEKRRKRKATKQHTRLPYSHTNNGASDE